MVWVWLLCYCYAIAPSNVKNVCTREACTALLVAVVAYHIEIVVVLRS
jgi:hypothetical protein